MNNIRQPSIKLSKTIPSSKKLALELLEIGLCTVFDSLHLPFCIYIYLLFLENISLM